MYDRYTQLSKNGIWISFVYATGLNVRNFWNYTITPAEDDSPPQAKNFLGMLVTRTLVLDHKMKYIHVIIKQGFLLLL